jgi:hypothetical protein
MVGQNVVLGNQTKEVIDYAATAEIARSKKLKKDTE